MPESKEIQYLNKDFDSFKEKLIDFSKTYYPNTYNSGNGVHIKPQISGVYKVTGNLFIDDSSGGTIIYDINVDGSTVYTATAKTHGAVDPVNRTIIYMGAISSGSTIGLSCDGASLHMDANSALMVERLS